MRVAVETVQLVLPDPAWSGPADRWWQLPETTRTQVLSVLAGLIARGVLIDRVEEPVVGDE
jgi:hypothetical protein